MRADKATGAKFALYNAGEDYARFVEAQAEKQPMKNPQMTGSYYIVAVGERLPPESEPVYITDGGEETTDPERARDFETYADALKWMVENCEITQVDLLPIPRGFERPRYPRVCYLRTYREITEL